MTPSGSIRRSASGLTTRLGRAFAAVMAALFAFGAAVQVNDPDPVRWIAIYAAACVASILAARGRPLPAAATGAVAAIAVLWAGTILVGGPGAADYGRMFDAWEMRSVAVEEAREVTGLLVIGAWMAVLAYTGRRRRSNGPV